MRKERAKWLTTNKGLKSKYKSKGSCSFCKKEGHYNKDWKKLESDDMSEVGVIPEEWCSHSLTPPFSSLLGWLSDLNYGRVTKQKIEGECSLSGISEKVKQRNSHLFH